MKVILLQDVAKIGKKNSVVDVPDGYGMNKLIPKGLAKPATKANLKLIERLQKDKSAAQSDEQTRFEAAVAALKEADVEIAAKANDDGALYEAVKLEALVSGMEAVTSLPVDPAWVVVAEPIKSTGTHSVMLRLGDDTVNKEITISAL